MIPLGDSVPRRRFPWVTYTLIAINVLVFLIELSYGPHVTKLFYRYGVVPARLAQWRQDPTVLLTLITSQFLHGGWYHIIGNMIYLWIFGDNVEDQMGHGRYLVFYLLSGIIAALVQSAMMPSQMQVPLIGASGAISGVLGAYMLFFPAGRVFLGIPLFLFLYIIDVPAVVALGYWFISQYLNGLLALASGAFQYGGVAWWAHVGGFVAGLVLGPVFREHRPRYYFVFDYDRMRSGK
ncbi:MAG: rhomboid family intramembrane serine protease [Chloroflexi bacterium]|nr:rhomboid family intramembrane serine protease [Chloroflexota bacterium]